jgi:hypothetical protein
LLLNFTPCYRQIQEELALPWQSRCSQNIWGIMWVSPQKVTNKYVEDVHHVLDSFQLLFSTLLYFRQAIGCELLLILYSDALPFLNFKP